MKSPTPSPTLPLQQSKVQRVTYRGYGRFEHDGACHTWDFAKTKNALRVGLRVSVRRFVGDDFMEIRLIKGDGRKVGFELLGVGHFRCGDDPVWTSRDIAETWMAEGSPLMVKVETFRSEDDQVERTREVANIPWTLDRTRPAPALIDELTPDGFRYIGRSATDAYFQGIKDGPERGIEATLVAISLSVDSDGLDAEGLADDPHDTRGEPAKKPLTWTDHRYYCPQCKTGNVRAAQEMIDFDRTQHPDLEDGEVATTDADVVNCWIVCLECAGYGVEFDIDGEKLSQAGA